MSAETIKPYSDDSFRMYLHEIGQVDMLTAEEEVELAKRIEAGRWADGVLAILPEGELAIPEELSQTYTRPELELVAEDGQVARTDFINANLRLVVSIAKKYQYRGVPLQDIVTEGNFGLMTAVDKFDYRTGNKFSTYATWWIRQAITRAISNTANTIRIPVHRVEQMSRHYAAQRDIETEMPSASYDAKRAAVAKRLHLSVKEVVELELLRSNLSNPLSLDAPVGDDGEASLGDFVGDNRSIEEDGVEREQLAEEILENARKMLKPTHFAVIDMRYRQGLTLEQVAEKMGYTRQRAQQVEAKSLRRIKHSLGIYE